jgi:hypothetical protein
MPSMVTCEHALRKSWNVIYNPRIYRERKLGVNSTMYGPALELSEYLHYFVVSFFSAEWYVVTFTR